GGLGGGGLGGGGLGRGGFGGRTIGGGVGLLVIVVVALFFGVDPSALLQGIDGGGTDSGYQQQPYEEQGSATSQPSPNDDEMKQFVSVVLADTEDTWTELFKDMGRTYQDPHLVLFTGQVRSACGFAQSAMGPFYCPGDSKVYIDLAFYDELQQRFHASGDFAQAYVVAHEIGHHVQHLLNPDMGDEMQGSAGSTGANSKSVRIELQADCYAGVWAYHANQERKILEEGDIEEALNAASAIGDDRLQEQTQGTVVPDSFTHGTSAQRVRWFKNGFSNGDIDGCDTFEAKTL
ncbi:MAG TPA: neutral zinc metallopeptidase, partial [Dongiaceae bacterium]